MCPSEKLSGMPQGRELRRSAENPFPLSHKIYRAVWRGAWVVLAAWTPPAMASWRRLVLIFFGAKMGKYTDVRGGARVWYPPNLVMEDHTILANGVVCYNQATIILRKGAIVSQGANLCSSGHDIDDPAFTLVARSIEIGRGAWIAAEAFVGPGTLVGERAVLGARGVAFKHLEPNTVYVGNPAVAIRQRAKVSSGNENTKKSPKVAERERAL